MLAMEDASYDICIQLRFGVMWHDKQAVWAKIFDGIKQALEPKLLIIVSGNQWNIKDDAAKIFLY